MQLLLYEINDYMHTENSCGRRCMAFKENQTNSERRLTDHFQHVHASKEYIY